MTTWITICDTCKAEGWSADTAKQTDGARFAEAIEAATQGTDIATRRVSCTMGCERACNIIVQATGKIGYSLGKFDGTPGDAAAVVEYAQMHAGSETGQVPFRQWPQGVKGHFVSRHVPLPDPAPDAE